MLVTVLCFHIHVRITFIFSNVFDGISQVKSLQNVFVEYKPTCNGNIFLPLKFLCEMQVKCYFCASITLMRNVLK